MKSGLMIKHETTYKEGRPDNPAGSTVSEATTETEVKDPTNTDTGISGWNAYVCVVDGPGSATEGDSDIQGYRTGCHMSRSSIQGQYVDCDTRTECPISKVIPSQGLGTWDSSPDAANINCWATNESCARIDGGKRCLRINVD
jgi:hypothetical protein